MRLGFAAGMEAIDEAVLGVGGVGLHPRIDATATKAASARAEEMRRCKDFKRVDGGFTVIGRQPFLAHHWVRSLSRLPTVQEAGNCRHAGVFELLLPLGVEEPTMGIEDGECGNAFGDWDSVLSGDVYVLIHVADVDVDENEVFFENLCVGALMVVDIEYLAVAAPVTAEVQEDALVLAGGAGNGDGDVSRWIGVFGVEMGVGLEESSLGAKIGGSRQAEHDKDCEEKLTRGGLQGH
jgi:hypothetical protein